MKQGCHRVRSAIKIRSLLLPRVSTAARRSAIAAASGELPPQLAPTVGQTLLDLP
jgi:hypothetical protein